jgi:pantoate--beta-alanine ligase
LQIVRRVARDLDITAAIEGVPIVREEDGLALSSRNAYLAPEERAVAPALHRALAELAARVAAGADPDAAARAGAEAILKAGFAKLDYLAVCDAETLEPWTARERPGRVLAAAWLGRTRLIDNEPVAPMGGAK